MSVNEVVYNGETLIDLKQDTVTPQTLAAGKTAHDAAGALIVGTATPVTLAQGLGQSVTAVMSQKAVNDALKGISLGIASDGLIYIFVNGTPIGTGIPQSTGASGDVFGYVDENNTIVLNGALADGTYSIKYEMDDGSTVDIGDLVLDSTVYYSITSTLTNCTNSNSTLSIAEGESYSATISAKDGYELSSVKVTMGGTDISAAAVSGGTIAIASVTGNVVITAVATEVAAPTYTNLADPTSADWANDCRLGSDGTIRTGCTGGVVTNCIKLEKGDVVRVKGIDLVNKIGSLNAHYVGIYNQNKGVVSVNTLASQTAVMSNITATDTGGQATATNANPIYIRFAGKLNGTADDVIITVNEPIE